jgi:hypothetical protein
MAFTSLGWRTDKSDFVWIGAGTQQGTQQALNTPQLALTTVLGRL